MIGTLTIEVEVLPVTGDRCDAVVRALGPGDTDYRFPVSVTRTVQRVWQITDDDVAATIEELARGIVDLRGTASAPPEAGYWFDSYNSDGSVTETLNKMRNLGIASFLKDRGAGDEIAAIFGGSILPELEHAQEVFAAQGIQFVRSLDAAFEYSEATADLSSPPSTKADFLYRICILSVIIDRFGVRLPDEASDHKSLKALTNWMAAKSSEAEARLQTEPFARIKDLRKQYPIHEHYEEDSGGQLAVRHEIVDAEQFFGFESHHDYPKKWKLVVDKFREAIGHVEAAATESQQARSDE